MYKQAILGFANLSVKKLLVGDLNDTLDSIQKTIEDNPDLAQSISDQKIAEVLCRTETGSEKLLGVNTITLGLQEESYKVCIIQDQSLYRELEKEKIAKGYLKKFFAMITHELRNPLQGLLGIFESLLEILKEPSNKDQCHMGISTTKLMMRLTNDLLDLSQMETEKFRLTNETTRDIAELMEECIGLMRYKYQAKGVSLRWIKVGDMPAEFKFDKNRYKQILLNLLGNAIKFTEAGEVVIRTQYSFENKQLITSVQDTGIGIKDEDKGKLFTFFGKLDDYTLQNPQGAGLGLYICKKLAVAMGGFVDLESEYLKGTTITFGVRNQAEENEDNVALEVPLKTEGPLLTNELERPPELIVNPEQKSTFASPEPNPILEPVALVVDDEFICTHVVQQYLKQAGITADTASSGVQAETLVMQQLAQGKCYRLIFIDLNMPIEDGFQTVEKVHELLQDRSPSMKPFIVGMSGDSGPDVEQKCKDAGMDLLRIFYLFLCFIYKNRFNQIRKMIVTKPVERSTVVSLIERLK